MSGLLIGLAAHMVAAAMFGVVGWGGTFGFIAFGQALGSAFALALTLLGRHLGAVRDGFTPTRSFGERDA